MEVKAKPLTRQEIMSLAVTDADAFTAIRFLRHRENVPSIPSLEEQGRKSLPGIEGSLLDIYHSLWSPEPGVKEDVPQDRRYWRELLGQAMNSSAYQELHGQTQFKELQSVLGTISMGESFVGMVSKDDQKSLQELAAQQQQANELDQQSQEAQAQANAAQELADAASQQSQSSQGAPQGQPCGGSGQMTGAQAQAIADQLAKQAAEARAQSVQVQAEAAGAQAKANQLAEQLMGKPGSPEAQKKLDELRRIGLAAATAAQAKVQEVSETLEAWGLEEGELVRKSIPESLGLLERMKRNEALKKFAALLGRIRKIAARKAKQKVSGEGARVTTLETGRDLKRAHRSEIIALLNPALRVKALVRWTRGELRQFGQKTKAKLGHGPVIVCEDGSGSMEGAKQQWAKAVVLSLAHYAKLQHRDFAWIHFGAKYTTLEVVVCKGGRISGEQMLTIAETFRNASGTDFEKPLTEALRIIRQGGLPKADIALITDGECAVSTKFLEELRATKKALEFNVITVLCDVGSSADATVKEFSDRVEHVSAFSAEEAENKLICHL